MWRWDAPLRGLSLRRLTARRAPGYQVPVPPEVPSDTKLLAQPGIVEGGPTPQAGTHARYGGNLFGSKVPLKPRETLSALYVNCMRLQGHDYRIRDDLIRRAHCQQYLLLLPQHAPQTRANYV